MKFKTLLIAGATLVALAGMTVAQMNSYQRGPSGPGAGAGSLSDAEIASILLIRQDEKIARDVYVTMYDLWGAGIFANISEAEQQHMDAVKQLITRYGLQDPIENDQVGQYTDPVFDKLYDDLVAAGSVSLVEALKVGVLIEELDIGDLDDALRTAKTRSVQRVFENLRSASYRHLDAFNSWL